MLNNIDFTFSDLIAGYVTEFEASKDSFGLKTPDGRIFEVNLTSTVFAEVVRNLGEDYKDASGDLRARLVPGAYLFAYGIFYPEEGRHKFEAKHIVFTGQSDGNFEFEKGNWWVNQIKQLADFYLEAQFGLSQGGKIDYRKYRTNLGITGQKDASVRQETDTVSRLVYGFASAYMLTGEERYLEAAQKGVEYLREHMRFRDKSKGICYWYHAIDLKSDGSEQKIFASEFGDDFDAIPCYEQIYALAGLTQAYRITGDPKIKEDVDATYNLFENFFRDKSPKGGFFSHLDPISFSPFASSLGKNRAKKNWNSVGDHAPAYLINLWLATGEQKYADLLEDTFDTVVAHFPDYEESPFVQERFFEDWTKDQTWSWQQNRAVVGHNLKIAWNLTRMYSLKPKSSYKELAEKIGNIIPGVGADPQRGGWYDVMERALGPNEKFHRLVWHDRKAWWQQEQGILAYYIMSGVYQNLDFIRFAREGASFYNAWFLDTTSGGVYFNVLANGNPYVWGTERGKGSHSMSGYHSFELCFLASVYNNLLHQKERMDLFFKPQPGSLEGNLLRVAPDILPAGSVRIAQVWINGRNYNDFDAENLTVKLPNDEPELNVRVSLLPVNVEFDADLMEIADGIARINLIGNLTAEGLKELQEELSNINGSKGLVFDMRNLKSISDEAMRYIAFYKQKAGSNFSISLVGANREVYNSIKESNLDEEIKLIPALP